MTKNNPFKIKFLRGTKSRYPTVYIYSYGLATVWPTITTEKDKAINETIDRAIDKLNELRIKDTKKR